MNNKLIELLQSIPGKELFIKQEMVRDINYAIKSKSNTTKNRIISKYT